MCLFWRHGQKMTMQKNKNINVSDRDILMSVLGELPCLIHLKKMADCLEHFSLNKIQHA